MLLEIQLHEVKNLGDLLRTIPRVWESGRNLGDSHKKQTAFYYLLVHVV